MKLNVESLMSRVRDEVIRRGGTFGSDDTHESTNVPGTFLHWGPAAGPIKIKPAYELSELLLHSDRAFVENAYLSVLRRLPDAAGLSTYLAKLRAGEMSKVEVLAALRWSSEGAARGIHVNGLLAPYLLQKWQRLPVVGPLLRWTVGILRIGDVADRTRRVEASQAAEVQELGRLVNMLTRQIQTKLTRIEEQLRDWSEESKSSKGEINRQLDSLRSQIADADSRAGDEFVALRAELAAEARSLNAKVSAHSAEIARLAGRSPDTHQYDQLYVDFEEAFRGPRDLIRERALPYLEIVRAAGAGTKDAPVIDLGCGRGDWLDLLREHGLIARGVDSNRVFLEMCAARGLDVVAGDVIEVLGRLPDGSAGAITGMHIAEHLPFEVLIKLLDECRRVLRTGGVLALETPNPENAWVAAYLFYMDPTHLNPLPPLALQWLVGARGFADVRIERWTVARDMGAPPLLPSEIAGAKSMNVLIGQIHNAPDYAIIARRP